MKHVIVIGAGPAGLTAAYELLKTGEYRVTVLEESETFGGISRTVNYKGNRMDMGGHRFFSKVPEVNEWWEHMMPTQGQVPYDDAVLHRTSTVKEGGPDPEKTDVVMLRRNRLSRILFDHKFFDYPISMKKETIFGMGLGTTMVAGCSYLKCSMFKREEKSLEDLYINQFGKKLYSMFFENYTENLWGRHPSEISPEWGAQRTKGLSVSGILKDMVGKSLHLKNRKVETSLIEEFAYPKFGPGQLWEITAAEVEKMGGEIIKKARVTKVQISEAGVEASDKLADAGATGTAGGLSVTGVTYECDGAEHFLAGDVVISSMPLKDLVLGMNGVPENVLAVAQGLPYRDYMTVGVLVDRLLLKNETDIPTIGNIVPDNWIYVHDRTVKLGRLQIYNNWSLYMVKDLEHTVWIGLEYFYQEGDEMWNTKDEDFARFGIKEMVKLGLIASEAEAKDSHVERVKKAYPAYFDTYAQIDELRAWIDQIPNLYCVGRNGQHRYNNIDHSMCTAFEAVKNIRNGVTDKSNIWNVNTEQEYHESK